MAGLQTQFAKPIDGLNLQPLLMAQASAASWPDRFLVSHWSGNVSVRSEKFRMDSAGKLYDMVSDPGQEKDASELFPQVKESHAAVLSKWKKEIPGGGRQDARPYTVGYKEFPATLLPARDGVAHGKIRRSASAPNSSFFENWTDPEDSITWDIEVANSGLYSVEVLHTCSAESVGAEVELSFEGGKTRATIDKPHDPPLKGAEHDRVKRQGESYVKDFKPFPMGELNLQKGRGLLTLKALKIPGGKVMDVRAVVLTLK